MRAASSIVPTSIPLRDIFGLSICFCFLVSPIKSQTVRALSVAAPIFPLPVSCLRVVRHFFVSPSARQLLFLLFFSSLGCIYFFFIDFCVCLFCFPFLFLFILHL